MRWPARCTRRMVASSWRLLIDAYQIPDILTLGVQVHVHVPLEEAEARDPKGLYVKAREGKIPNFTGISDPYEEPENPEVKLNTHEMSVHACVGALIHELKAHGIITTRMKIDSN